MKNCTELKTCVFSGFNPEGAPMSFPSCCRSPHWIPLPSQFKCLFHMLGRLRSKPPHSRAILALPYSVSELYSLLFLHIQANVWKHSADLSFFCVETYWNSHFQLVEHLSVEIVGRNYWVGVCLMMELQPET